MILVVLCAWTTKLASNFYESKIWMLVAVQVIYWTLIIFIRPINFVEANIILSINELFFLFLSSLLLHFNRESRWSSSFESAFINSIIGNNIVVLLIIIGKYSCLIYSNINDKIIQILIKVFKKK